MIESSCTSLPASLPRARRSMWVAAAVLLAGCASEPTLVVPARPNPATVKAQLARAIPALASDRAGWQTDIYAAFTTLDVAPTPANLCGAVAVIEQESSFQADPAVSGLPAIAWREIDRRAEQVGVPSLVVRTALLLKSPDGRSYSERLDSVKTERQLSDIYEDFIGMVPMGRSFFEQRNPVRTGGPMQVSIGFAETQANARPYPYPVDGSIRHEVFTRRGGVYFGVAHLLDYPAPYPQMIFRFADFNAGRYASRNAAFQQAVSVATGVPLALDGDLIRFDSPAGEAAGSTETALKTLGSRLELSTSAIQRDLSQGKTAAFSDTQLYARVFALADRTQGAPLPRAVLPRIVLRGPKITRTLTTEWYANRVDERSKRCLARLDAAS